MLRATRWALILALIAARPSQATPAGESTWLLVSDIHFNPFADPAAVDMLAAEPVEKWSAILSSGRQVPPAYGMDSPASLLEASLAEMRRAVPDPAVVVISGDYLVHDFRGQFQKSATAHDEKAFEAFADKTIAYLALRFRDAFPDAAFIPAVGNNDGYCDDYGIAPGSPFLAHMAAAWAPLVDRSGSAPDFVKSFSAAGHYVASIPGSAVRIVVVNSVFWLRKYDTRCVQPGDHPPADELHWLESALASPHEGKTTWIVTHIPPGIDAFASARDGKGVTFYATRYLDSFLSDLNREGSGVSLVIAGHLHAFTFRLSDASSVASVPILDVPSVSPVFGNNPGFLVAKVSPAGEITDFSAHAMDLSARAAANTWTTDYTFSTASGGGALTVGAISKLEARLAADPAARARFDSAYASGSSRAAITDRDWRKYWCTIEAMRPADWNACVKAGR